MTKIKILFFKTSKVIVILFALTLSCFGEELKGKWSFNGKIQDLRMWISGVQRTNTLDLTGYYDNGHFLLEIEPINAEDDIAETAAWDGNVFYHIQRWHNVRGRNIPRDKAMAYIEPSVFARYSTEALQAVAISFADDEKIAELKEGSCPIILSARRVFPEETNNYVISFSALGDVNIEAQAPGLELGEKGLETIKGFENGFKRWKHVSNFRSLLARGSMEFEFKYERYTPINGKLVQERLVTGNLIFEKTTEVPAEFKPPISESELMVQDFTARKELYPLTKGIIDWVYTSVLTNHVWDLDTNSMRKALAGSKAFLLTNGIPTEVSTTANSTSAYKKSPPWGIARIVLVSIIATLAVLGILILLIFSRR